MFLLCSSLSFFASFVATLAHPMATWSQSVLRELSDHTHGKEIVGNSGTAPAASAMFAHHTAI